MSDSFTNSSYVWPSGIIILSTADGSTFEKFNHVYFDLQTGNSVVRRVKAYIKDRSGHGLLLLDNPACKGSLFPVEFKEWYLQLYYISNNR